MVGPEYGYTILHRDYIETHIIQLKDAEATYGQQMISDMVASATHHPNWFPRG